MPDDQLAGRAAIITGASQGLGREIAAAYLRAGASVVICARDAAMLEAVRAELGAIAGADRVIAHGADVSKPDQVAALVDRAIAAFPHVDILVNSAGVYGPKGAIEDTEWAAWVQAIEIDLFGAVLLCRAIVPHLKRRGGGKIIQLSGGGATAPMPRLSAYATAKAAVVRFAESLALEVADHQIDVNCIAPGALNTRMLDEILAAGPEVVGAAFYARSLEQKRSGGAGLERGAALAVWLATRASDGITGRLLSAIWDPWPELAARKHELAGSDIYTLRRVVPRDRGKDWGDS
jgi:NAD(P)-dependent dehydrogenase (short-subunit alcohol dehydrogenase family)